MRARDFEDVLRIDHASISATAIGTDRPLGSWRIVFGNERVPMTVAPCGLVCATQRYAAERARQFAAKVAPDSSVFGDVYGKQITRASLCAAIGRAMTLVRLAHSLETDDFGHIL